MRHSRPLHLPLHDRYGILPSRCTVRAEMNVPNSRKATAYVVCEDQRLCGGLEFLRNSAKQMASLNDLVIRQDKAFLSPALSSACIFQAFHALPEPWPQAEIKKSEKGRCKSILESQERASGKDYRGAQKQCFRQEDAAGLFS